MTNPAAPTVADLRRRGLEQVDFEPAGGPPCGPDCVNDGFSAIYMGPHARRDGPSDRQFICPTARGDMESWRCRPVSEAERTAGTGPPPPPDNHQ